MEPFKIAEKKTHRTLQGLLFSSPQLQLAPDMEFAQPSLPNGLSVAHNGVGRKSASWLGVSPVACQRGKASAIEGFLLVESLGASCHGSKVETPRH